MKVAISDKELTRIPKAEKYYNELGLEVTVENLEYGDYVFDDKVAFEYKTMSDFISSIQDHRVFNECINQAENFDWHYLIIQGNEHDRSKCLAMTKHYVPVTIFQYHGAIASINRYSTVMEVYSPFINESFYKMYIQAKKDLSDKPVVKKFPRKDKNYAFNWLCYCNYGLNAKKAQLIVDELGLKTLTDLQRLTYDDLTMIKGIGDNLANRILGGLR